MASTNELVFAKALLHVHEGTPFEPSLVETLRSLCEPVPSEADTKILESSNTTTLIPKGRRKITRVAALPAKATESIVLAPHPEPEKKTEAEGPALSVVTSIPVYTNDPYKTHKHRLQTLDPTKCMGRKCVNTHLVVGTRTEDKNIGANGRIYIEFQCGNLPAGPIEAQQDPGPLDPKEGSSRLCQTHLNREAKYKTDRNKVWPEWFGRLDDADLYHNSRIIGSGYFFEKYPKGLANDPTTAPPVNELILEAPAETTVAPKRGRKPKVAAVLKDSKSVEAAPLGDKGPPLGDKGPKESVAVNIAPKEVEWISFKHEGRMHIRNIQSGSVYWVDSTKKSAPSEMAVKERYVGKWIDGALDTLADTDDDEV